MEDILLDDSGNFVLAADGDVETVQDLECLIQDAKHLLLTFPGDLWAHRDYGTGIQRFIQAEDTELNRLELQQLIKTKLARDDRIKDETIKVSVGSWELERISLLVTFLPVNQKGESTTEQKAAITLTISQTGITFEG